eukprot:TRINITY_DN12854_c0_g1_i2.p1 TRINITY_DN12854_c0_g1~~TRINITY_DN12854_c0_g1_i2.p1  ORF type:complete len:110 (-),score=31.63 TRINITY_DN12854_c0_g1_i2:1-330(-)
MYEVPFEAIQLSEGLEAYTPLKRKIVTSEFQKMILRRFGTIEEAWYGAFDLDDSGSIDFSEFCSGCKRVGYCGNLTKLWSMLDLDGSGSIEKEELTATDVDADEMEDEE